MRGVVVRGARVHQQRLRADGYARRGERGVDASGVRERIAQCGLLGDLGLE
jgi:hypothetical protein